jgi:DNA-binding transcriptional regulator YiaG
MARKEAMPKTTTYLSVLDSFPGKALKVNKTRTVGVSLDAQGEVHFQLNARVPKRWRSPSPEAIRKARKTAGLTQREAAEKCYSALRSWQDWEYGQRRMHPAVWQVFLGATRATGATRERKRSAPAGGSARRARPQRESAA